MSPADEEPFYGPHYRPTPSRDIVWTRSGIGIGSAHVRPPMPMTDEAIRMQAVALSWAAIPENRDPSPWIRAAESAGAGDEHVQAMVATPADADRERVHRIVDRIMGTLLVAILFCLCVAGWNRWLPGGGL